MVRLKVDIFNLANGGATFKKVQLYTNSLSHTNDAELKIRETLLKLDIELPNEITYAYMNEQGKMIVHQNVTFAPAKKTELFKGTLKQLAPLRKTFNEDMKDANRAKRWAEGRAQNMIFKSVELSPVKYLRDYLGVEGKDNLIRDMAQQLVDAINASEIIFCEQPSDYVRMFEVPTRSCMCAAHDDYYNTTTRTYLYQEHDLWPSIWYHYNPLMQGVYMKSNGKPVARAFLKRKTPDAAWTGYQHAHGTAGGYSSILNNRLTEITGSPDNIPIDFIDMEIPAHEIGNKLLCPNAYADAFYNEIYVKYDPDRKMFMYSKSGSQGGTYFSDLYGPGNWLDHEMNEIREWHGK